MVIPMVILQIAAQRGASVTGVDFAPAMVEYARRLHPGLDFREGDANALPFGPATFDAAVASFGLLHFDRPEHALVEMRRVLRPGGRVLVLQPNIRLVGGSYWNFIDHRVALTDRSLVEAAGSAGFKTVRLIKRFLPFTTKGRLPQHPALVRAYLAFPPAWLLMGKQSLYLGEL